MHHLRRVQGKTAHAAIQIPERARLNLPHPLTALRVHRLRNLRVRLKETLRAQVQAHAVHAHRQGLPLGQNNLLIALNQRHMLAQQIHRQHRQLRQTLLQPPQLAANRHQQLLRAEHKPHHQLTRLGCGHQNILELTTPGRNVIRGQIGTLNKLVQHRNSALNRLNIERAFA